MAFFQVIKFDGPQDALVWKHPKENMNSGSQLVVGPAQTAVFVREGQICDLFESGTYMLDTNNLPILSALVNLPFGGRSPFTAEVFYVNQRSILDIKWGTPVPIQLKDPLYQVIIPLRAFGQYGVSVQDPGLFVEKLVGTSHAYTTDDLIRYFRGKHLVVINMQPTGADRAADLCIAKPIGQVLSEEVYLDDAL